MGTTNRDVDSLIEAITDESEYASFDLPIHVMQNLVLEQFETAQMLYNLLEGKSKVVCDQVRTLDSRFVLIQSTDADLRSNCIGHMRLPWKEIDGEDLPQWMDTAFIARKDGEWTVLPLCEDEKESGIPEEEWSELWLTQSRMKEWSVATLRKLYPHTTWVYKKSEDGLGVFLCCVFDFDATATIS